MPGRRRAGWPRRRPLPGPAAARPASFPRRRPRRMCRQQPRMRWQRFDVRLDQSLNPYYGWGRPRQAGRWQQSGYSRKPGSGSGNTLVEATPAEPDRQGNGAPAHCRRPRRRRPGDVLLPGEAPLEELDLVDGALDQDLLGALGGGSVARQAPPHPLPRGVVGNRRKGPGQGFHDLGQVRVPDRAFTTEPFIDGFGEIVSAAMAHGTSSARLLRRLLTARKTSSLTAPSLRFITFPTSLLRMPAKNRSSTAWRWSGGRARIASCSSADCSWRSHSSLVVSPLS